MATVLICRTKKREGVKTLWPYECWVMEHFFHQGLILVAFLMPLLQKLNWLREDCRMMTRGTSSYYLDDTPYRVAQTAIFVTM